MPPVFYGRAISGHCGLINNCLFNLGVVVSLACSCGNMVESFSYVLFVGLLYTSHRIALEKAVSCWCLASIAD